MSPAVAIVLGSIAAIALTVFLYIKVLPKKLDGTFQNKYLQFLHDYFHFKKLYLEEVLKGIFTLASVACVTIGAFMLISFESYYSYYSDRRYTTSYFWYGLLLIVCGPVALRLIYEGIMMLILLVKNVLEINNKLQAPAKEEDTSAPVAEAEAAEEAPEVI